nr:histone deacetylase [Nannocystis sp.]
MLSSAQRARFIPDRRRAKLTARVQIFYTDHYVLPLPPGHRFPMAKYARLRERVEAAGLGSMHVPEAATREQLALAHDLDYVDRVHAGTLDAREQRELGFPWSPAMLERSLRSTGATISACRAALADGFAVNLAGGTHHAFAGRGEGYCVFNDSAVAARVMQAEGRVRRVVIIDCDVHQGNGTAAILANDPSIFTLSIHGANNFPFTKQVSDLDIHLPDGTGDAAYLAALHEGLTLALDRSRAELAIFLAGADPFAGDRLGRLELSKDGLARRDHLVLATCRDAGLPVALSMAGGYARELDDIVDIHLRTVETAAELAGLPGGHPGVVQARAPRP